METLPLGEPVTDKLLKNHVLHLVAEGKLEKAQENHQVEEEILFFFESEIGKRLQRASKVYRELPFIYQLSLKENCEKSILQGMIDCCFEEEGAFVLLDYKTGYLSDTEQMVIQKNQKQIQLYRDAFENITGKRIKESYIYSFAKKKALKVE